MRARLLGEPPSGVRSLPPHVDQLLARLEAPPRLTAHLLLVHDVAWQLADGLQQHWPGVGFDREAVLVGAATHDVGKILVPEELSSPGTRHEEVGESVLIENGFQVALARYARTHGGPAREPQMTLEDWLVMAADSIWKGARRPLVEDALYY